MSATEIRINWGTATDRQLVRRLIDRAIGGKKRAPLAARELLASVLELWFASKSRMEDDGREWLVWSREEWAELAGLTDHEIKDTALPVLRKLDFLAVKIKPVRLRKRVWISVDEAQLAKHVRDLINLSHDAPNNRAAKGMAAARKRSMLYGVYEKAFGKNPAEVKVSKPKPKGKIVIPVPAKTASKPVDDKASLADVLSTLAT